MLTAGEERIAYRAFRWGVLVKGLAGAAETFAGLALLLVSAASVGQLGISLFARELADDPGDFLAAHLNRFFIGFSASTKTFVIAYFLLHGAANLFLAAGLLKQKRWGYPVALCLMGVFLVYQLYRLYAFFSPMLLGFAIFDAAVLALVWHQSLHARVGEAAVGNTVESTPLR